MAGVALLSDLLKRSSQGISAAKPLFPGGFLSATVAASIAGISASRSLFPSGGGASVAFCDADVSWKDDYIPNLRGHPDNTYYFDSIKHGGKQYPIEIKPLFSAFRPKSFAIISLRSFLLFYLPLLEPPRPPLEEDDDFLLEPDVTPVDLVVPFKKSVKQIARETTIITTRRILERLAVHYASQRMAWKLLKDVPKSARRKAGRGWSSSFFIFSVSRTTFRGQLLAVAATWLVQVGIEIYSWLTNPQLFRRTISDEDEELDRAEKMRLLGKRITCATMKCCGSLVFASVVGGICATFHPSIGQWIGCALGDFAGPVIVTVFFERYLQLNL